MSIVAAGTDIQELADYEYLFREGEKGEVRLLLERPMTPAELVMLQGNLAERGVVLTKPIAQQGNMVTIGFQKAEPALVSLTYFLAGGAIVVVSWYIIKSTFSAIPWWVWFLAGGLGGLWLAQKKGGIRLTA